MSVAAVLGEVEEVSTPPAMILPGLPPLFSCGAVPCNVQMEDKFDEDQAPANAGENAGENAGKNAGEHVMRTR